MEGKTYTVDKSIKGLENLDGYKKTNIKIQDNSVEALYNSITGLTLVGLKNENGNSSLYIYDTDNNSYKKYIELKSNGLTIIPMDATEKLRNYDKYNEVIDGNEIECYKISETSNYCAIYAMNAATGESGWYMYNFEDGTINIYNKDDDDIYKEKKQDNSRMLIYILSGTTLLFGVLTIIFAIKSGKRRK